LRPHLSASCTKTAAAAMVAWRGGCAPPKSQRAGPAPLPVARPPPRPPPRPVPRPLRARPSRVAQGQRGGWHECVGRGFRLWKMTMEKISTFTLPSSAAPDTPSATSCTTSCAISCAASFTCSSFTCRPRADLAPQTPKRAEDIDFFLFLELISSDYSMKV